MTRRGWLRAAVAVVVLVALVTAYRFGLLHGGSAAELRATIESARHVRGLIPLFVISYIVLAAVGVPASPLTLAGGALFGAALGTLLNWLSAVCAALLSYAIARSVGPREPGRVPVVSSALSLFRLRLIPVVPFFLLNVGAALARMPVFRFVLATALGVIPVTVIYTVFAASLLAGVAGSERRALVTALLTACIIIAISLAPRALSRRS